MKRRAVCAAIGVLACGAATAQEAAPPELDWKRGPGVVAVGDVAEIELSDAYVSLDRAGAQTFLELNQNPVAGNEVAIVAPVSDEEQWFLVFEWDEIGYVKDDEKDALDAEAMLASIREGTEAGNAERAKRGWPPMTIAGWQEEPHYDAKSNNLTWAIIGESEGRQTVNKLVKLLGRRGVMTATLVANPDQLVAASTTTDALLGAYRFQSGSRYAEFVEGDSIAEIGLKGLILGGAGAALVKSGLLGKFWKAIVVGVLALGAGLRRLFGARSAGNDGTPT
jgi:uncharacterized membrane-anchored protein